MMVGFLRVLRGALPVALLPAVLWANRDGAQPRKTGGPFPSESVCTECHSNGSIRLNGGPGSVNVSLQVLSSGGDPAHYHHNRRSWGSPAAVGLPAYGAAGEC